MWLAADTLTSVPVTVVAAGITAAGTIIGSVLLARKTAPVERAARKRSERPRRRAALTDRMTRMESWKEQYADPILHRMANALDWDDDDE